MPVSNINNTYTNNNQQNRNTSGVMGQEDFLKIFVAQMRYQDPLSPTNDKEFMSQMAQFSTLEQMVNLNTKISNLSFLLATGFDSTNAFNMIDKVVEIDIGKDEPIKGVVDKVLQKNGEFLVEVKGVLYSLTQILSVTRGENNGENY